MLYDFFLSRTFYMGSSTCLYRRPGVPEATSSEIPRLRHRPRRMSAGCRSSRNTRRRNRGYRLSTTTTTATRTIITKIIIATTKSCYSKDNPRILSRPRTGPISRKLYIKNIGKFPKCVFLLLEN